MVDTNDVPPPPLEGDAAPGSAAEVLARAEAAVAELGAKYPVWALQDLGRAQIALDLARLDPGACAEQLERVYGIAHDIKGQAGSFGFQLATRVGQSLCRLLRRAEPGEDALALAQRHLDALRLVFERDLHGDGGEAGLKLAERLEEMVGRRCGAPGPP